MIRNNTHGGDHKQQELIEIILNHQAIVEKVKDLQKWIERDITAAEINHELVMVRVLTHHNKELKKILSTTYHSKCSGGKNHE